MRNFALVLGFGLFSTSAMAADPAAGKKQYDMLCVACHGGAADGKGPAAAALKPPPADFTSKKFWEGKKDESLRATIKNGKAGGSTGMAGFPHLNEQQINDLVAYLRTKQPK
ncbi:MAG: cytochrome c [Myxococcota bacterium]|nr:cytochrome c [Myxococcota bacterium]